MQVKQALKIEMKIRMAKYDLSRAPEFSCHGNRLINLQNLITPNFSQVNLRKSHEVEILKRQSFVINKGFKSGVTSNTPPPPQSE